MVLKNPTPNVPTNNKNNLVFKQIQTAEYDLHKIQRNVQSLSSEITKTFNKSIVTTATQPQIKTYTLATTATRAVLLFPKLTNDSTKSYDENTALYTAPETSTFALNISGTFNVTAGTPTRLYIYVRSDVQGIIATAILPVINNEAYMNLNYIVNLSNNEHVSYLISSDVNGTTVALSADARSNFYVVR